MSDNLVDRIRAEAKEMTTLGQALDMLHVADKIEIQQAEIERLDAAAQAMRDAGNAMAEILERVVLLESNSLLLAWKEASRG